MGLTKSGKDQGKGQGKGGSKTSNFTFLGGDKGKSALKAPGDKDISQKDKNKALSNLLTSMEQSGLAHKDKSNPLGYSIKDKKDVIPGIANMFLKIPSVTPKDLAGVDPDVLQDWINQSPEVQDLNKQKGGGAGGNVGATPPRPIPPVATPARGPGWISITRLLGRNRV